MAIFKSIAGLRLRRYKTEGQVRYSYGTGRVNGKIIGSLLLRLIAYGIFTPFIYYGTMFLVIGICPVKEMYWLLRIFSLGLGGMILYSIWLELRPALIDDIFAYFYNNFVVSIRENRLMTYCYPFVFFRQTIPIDKIASFSVVKQDTCFFDWRNNKPVYYRLNVKLNTGESVLIKYWFYMREEAEYIKQVIESPYQVINSEEVDDVSAPELLIEEQSTVLSFYSSPVIKSDGIGADIFWRTMFLWLFIYPLFKYFLQQFFHWYWFLGVYLALFADHYYYYLKNLSVHHVEVKRTYLRSKRVGMIFSTHTILRQKIQNIVVLLCDDDEYQISVIQKDGAMHELPLSFGSEESAQEQIEKIKKLMQLEE